MPTLKKTNKPPKTAPPPVPVNILKKKFIPSILEGIWGIKDKTVAQVSRLSIKPSGKIKILLLVLILIVASAWTFWGIPLPTQLTSQELAVSSKLFDRNGKLIYEFYTKERRTPIKIDDLPEYVWQSTVSIEDKDFFHHYGFSPTGIARAMLSIIFQKKLEGGSTLTQQLVKNALLTPERTVKRKVREFALTVFVEALYPKKQILEMYLNQIPYGSTAYGVEAASELYFGKDAKNLTIGEAAFLAGLPAAPSTYSPFGAHPELAKGRQATVLRRMVEDKYITQEQADEAQKQELKFADVQTPSAPHFAFWLKEQLAEKYGEKVIDQGGLRITTTLDLSLQDYAQQAVATEVGKLKKQKVGNGAVIVTKPDTGEILAMVGSKDYFATDEDGKVNVILAKRQPGSSIKPLNYALAIQDKKITAATAIADVPTCFSVIGQELYCPINYDNNFHGLIQARFALGNSYNIPAVKVLALNGVPHFVDFANKLGITTFTDPSKYGLSLTLGGGEIKPIDMAEAFGVLANGGIKQPLISILKIQDWKGNTLEEVKPNDIKLTGSRVLSPEVSFIVSHILLDNNA
ncbi:penicillin-binding protein, partial [Candidatus Woesebacteria bacterium]|nr:penicillin-binding protein [Candidatus Woesebacteria bacterium]